MPLPPVQNSNVLNVNGAMIHYADRLSKAKLELESVRAALKETHEKPPEKSGEITLQTAEKLEKRKKTLKAEISMLENLLKPAGASKPAVATRPTDQVISAAPPRAEQSTSKQKPIPQAPPKAPNIHNLGLQLAAKWAAKPVPPFKVRE